MDNLEVQKYEPLFGAWYVKRKLGQGSVGRVYEIQREELGEVYRSALKVISIPTDEDEARRVITSGVKEEDLPQYYRHAMEDFTKEIAAMSRLRGNSNIVSYEDHMTIPHEDGIGWDILMRMELLTPLTEYVLDHEMTEQDVIRMGIDLSRALELCDQAGIIHRDVKPDNVFYSPSGSFKLGDFGIARIAQTTKRSLSHKGTVTYMAPEVYRGEPFNASADIYSLGLVLYNYLNKGRLPFMPAYPSSVEYNDSEKAFRQRMQKKDMPAPAEGSAELQQIVLKACAPDPSERYASSGELREELEALLAGTYELHGPVEKQGSSKRKWWVLIGILAALAVTGLLVYAFTPKEVTGITGIASAETIYIGETLSPHYGIEPDRFSDEPIMFATDTPQILEVSGTGQVTALSLGEGEMTMTAKEYTQKCDITVIPKVTDISGVSDFELTEGESKKLAPTLSPEEFSDEPIRYDSSDDSVATVTEGGKVKAKSPGTAEITISAGGCDNVVRITVEEKPAPVVYNNSGGSSNKSSGSKKSSGGSGSSGSSKGHFDNSKDEYF